MQNDPNKKRETRGSPTGGRRSAAERRAARAKEREEKSGVPASPASQATTTSQTRAVDRRAERERERRRQRLTTYAIIAVVAVVVIIGTLLIVNAPADAPLPEDALTRYEGLLASRTSDGFPRLGDPDTPVQVVEYSSFDCEGCRVFHEQLLPAVIERVRNRQIAYTFVPLYGYGTIANGQGAARAALCASEQNQFWPFHEMLFSWQDQFAPNQVFTQNRIVGGVGKLPINRASYDACVASGGPSEILDRAVTQTRGLLNFTGAPAVTINGVIPVSEENVPLVTVDEIIAAIDRAVELAASNRPAPEATAEVTPETTPEAEATLEPEATVESTPETTAAPPEPDAEATEEA